MKIIDCVLICLTALFVGIGLGLLFERIGQILYFKRKAKALINNGGKMMSPWSDRFKSLDVLTDIRLEDEKNGKPEIVFLGDSITDMYALSEFFPAKNVANRGISGDTTDGILKRLQNQVIKLSPKIIVLLIGTNDLGDGLPPLKVLNNIKQIIERIDAALPNCKIILEKVYMVNEKMHKNPRRTNKRISELNTLIENEFSSDNKVVLLDVNTVLGKDEFNMQFTYDGLHPNFLGYSEITRFLKENIPELR